MGERTLPQGGRLSGAIALCPTNNVSGIGVDFGLFRGGQIKTESLESVLAGGIAFATPDNDIMGKRVKNGAVFSLFDASEGEWLTWKPKIPL